MYALLLPSAHNFISAVEENVNVLVRPIGVPTPTPTPCLFPSPACTALVCAPRSRAFTFDVGIVVFMVLPFWGHRSGGQAPIWADWKIRARSRKKSPGRVPFRRSEERRVGKEGRSRWAPYH